MVNSNAGYGHYRTQATPQLRLVKHELLLIGHSGSNHSAYYLYSANSALMKGAVLIAEINVDWLSHEYIPLSGPMMFGFWSLNLVSLEPCKHYRKQSPNNNLSLMFNQKSVVALQRKTLLSYNKPSRFFVSMLKMKICRYDSYQIRHDFQVFLRIFAA